MLQQEALYESSSLNPTQFKNLLLGDFYLKNLINSKFNIGSLKYTVGFHTE